MEKKLIAHIGDEKIMPRSTLCIVHKVHVSFQKIIMYAQFMLSEFELQYVFGE